DEHRMLVVGDRLIAVVLRETPRVVGDGAQTVRNLLLVLNADPRRNKRELHPVVLDGALERTLAWQGLTLDDIPEAGRLVILSRLSNVSKGGKPIDVTDLVHPDNAQLAVKAARAIGLDIAGIDVITRDITRSWREVAATIIEVNARPGIHIHVWPSEGTSRDVASPILDLTFPDGSRATPPTFVVGGDRSIALVARCLAQLCQSDGQRVGISLEDRAYIDMTALDLRDGPRNDALPLLMRQPDIEAFVIATSLRRVARRGLSITRCDGAVIMPMQRVKETALFGQGLDVLVRATAGPIAMRCADGRRIVAAGRVDATKLVLVDDSADDTETRQWIAAGFAAAVKTWRADGPYVELYSGGRLRAQSRLATLAQMRRSSVEASMLAFALYHASKQGNWPAVAAHA
ncbi:MAG: hypothetical protein WBP38_06475, partial [Hyphomicrobium sp.]